MRWLRGTSDLEVGLEELKEAKKHEESGRNSAALRKYEEALSLLLAALKKEQNPERAALLRGTIEEHMVRAEALKAAAARPASKQQLPDHHDYSAAVSKRAAEQPSREPARVSARARSPAPASRRPAPRQHSPPRATRQQRPLPQGRGGGASSAAAAKAGAAVPPQQTAASLLEERILSEMLDASPGVRWEDVAGLEAAKRTLKEAVVLPYARPDLYRGLRAPPRGVLLFGPPGTGKTMLARAVASESGFSFFAVSAAALTSKWVGEGEKLVRALFDVAAQKSPSVIFLDELDSLLSKRGESSEHEASRRIKTEFMVRLDGATTPAEGTANGPAPRVLFMGATNRPWDLDDAVLRRLTRKILIPLPDRVARGAFLDGLLDSRGRDAVASSLSKRERATVVANTDLYSMSDLRALAEEAAHGPLRELGDDVRHAKTSDVRPVTLKDFQHAVKVIKPSADPASLQRYEDWAASFGTRG